MRNQQHATKNYNLTDPDSSRIVRNCRGTCKETSNKLEPVTLQARACVATCVLTLAKLGGNNTKGTACHWHAQTIRPLILKQPSVCPSPSTRTSLLLSLSSSGSRTSSLSSYSVLRYGS